jgi:hypothetical protein
MAITRPKGFHPQKLEANLSKAGELSKRKTPGVSRGTHQRESCTCFVGSERDRPPFHVERIPAGPDSEVKPGLVLANFAPLEHGFPLVLEFVFSSFFGTFVDSKELI